MKFKTVRVGGRARCGEIFYWDLGKFSHEQMLEAQIVEKRSGLRVVVEEGDLQGVLLDFL